MKFTSQQVALLTTIRTTDGAYAIGIADLNNLDTARILERAGEIRQTGKTNKAYLFEIVPATKPQRPQTSASKVPDLVGWLEGKADAWENGQQEQRRQRAAAKPKISKAHDAPAVLTGEEIAARQAQGETAVFDLGSREIKFVATTPQAVESLLIAAANGVPVEMAEFGIESQPETTETTESKPEVKAKKSRKPRQPKAAKPEAAPTPAPVIPFVSDPAKRLLKKMADGLVVLTDANYTRFWYMDGRSKVKVNDRLMQSLFEKRVVNVDGDGRLIEAQMTKKPEVNQIVITDWGKRTVGR